jgi:peptide/nickel transport system permease protein
VGDRYRDDKKLGSRHAVTFPAVRYLRRRLGHAVVVLFAVSVLLFLLAEAAPGDFMDELRQDPAISDATINALRERYGLDRSLPERYVSWLRSVARGEVGFSMAYEGPVGPLLWPRVRNTLLLTVPATVFAWLIAVPLGAWAASRSGSAADRLVAGATTALLSIPELLVGLCLLLIALRSGFFPTGGMVSPDFAHLGRWDQLRDVVSHFTLPVTALTLITVPVIVRHVRFSVIDVLQAPFIQAARAQGVPERRVLFRYALKAAANPLISLLGLSIGGLLSASLLIETIMSWPGLGPLLLQAVAARDLHLVLGAVTCSTALFLAGTLLADALLYVADPRMRPDRQ